MAKQTSIQNAEQAARDISAENAPDSPVVQSLRRQVANGFVLYANYKHYHWQVFGPLFRDLHKLFDELAHEVLDNIDPVAERVRMIGQDPPARLIEMNDLATVSAAAPHSSVREMIEEADRNLVMVIKEIREGALAADEHGDPGTNDVLAELVQVYEKHEWWLRDMLRKGDGLSSI
jgi:starvation-inducible DNA-binding protein